MKKILAFVLLVSFISGAGLMFSSCSKDDNNKKKITGGGSVFSLEGTWERADQGIEFYKFTGSNVIYVQVMTDSSLSFKGTFEDKGTYFDFSFTSKATGNAITGSVT